MTINDKRAAFADMAIDRGTDYPVTAWIEQYRRQGSPMNMDCLEIAYQAMVKDLSTGNRADGKGRLRPSAIGDTCARAQAFSFFGAPTAEKEDWIEQKAMGGTLSHYWFQAEGMSAGWITDIEVPVEIPEWRLRGQLDGMCIDGSVLELKTLSTQKYEGLYRKYLPVAKWTSAKPDHIKQCHAYMHATGARFASIVYMDRGERTFREFRIAFDQALFDEMDAQAKHILALADDRRLPDRLFGCQMLQDGYDPKLFDESDVNSWLDEQRWCNYKEICRHADPREW